MSDIAQRKLHNLIEAEVSKAKQLGAELRALLEKWQFPTTYIDEVVLQLEEAYMNGDKTPVWTWPNYKPGGD